MTTVQALATRVANSSNEITGITAQITSAFSALSKNPAATKRALSQSKAENDLDTEAAMYNRLFEEEEGRLQALGGKTRHQTLQEFVLLFFFVAYGVFTISLAIMAFTKEGSSAALKILGAMLFSLLLISGILIRYA